LAEIKDLCGEEANVQVFKLDLASTEVSPNLNYPISAEAIVSRSGIRTG
jgi:hypothetical protein